MPRFNVRAYGCIDFQVDDLDLEAAKRKINRMFDRDNPVDPLTSRIITPSVTCAGFMILLPSDTMEQPDHDDD